jgi:hypothetical protein
MSKRINSKSELPKSFDLEKYKALDNMSDKDLFRQIYWRMDDLRATYKEFHNCWVCYGSDYPLYETVGDPFGELKESDFFVEKQKEYQNKEKQSLLTLSYGDGIRPVDRFLVSLISEMEAENGCYKGGPIIIDKDEGHELIEQDNGLFWQVMREPVNLLNDCVDGLLISVDLDNRDDLLIESFSSLLKRWRKELNIPEPRKPIAGGWESIRKKIIEYKIIPLIDLLAWEKSSDSKISLGVLAVALFPDGEKDSIMIAQTIKPFLEKLMSFESLEKIRKDLSNNLS